jgi:hypothetical protein
MGVACSTHWRNERFIQNLSRKAKRETATWTGLRVGTSGGRALVVTVMNLLVPNKARDFLISCVTISLSRTLLHEVVWDDSADPGVG